MHAQRGDHVVLTTNRRGRPPEEGDIIDIIDQDRAHERYVVRWVDGRLSLLFADGGYRLERRHAPS